MPSKKYAHINFTPPQDVQAAARRGLALRRKFGRGGLSRKEASAQGIGSGVQRATNLANGDKVSPETIGRMVSFFARHEKNKDSKTPSGEPGAGQIAWLLWGGTPGQRWATKVKRQMEAADMQKKSLATLAQQILVVRGAIRNETQNGDFPPFAEVTETADKAGFIQKIGARHTSAECATIQKIHNLTLDLGAECHPLTRRAGARHSHADQAMVQRIHDDCAGLGAECKALPEKDRVYSSQTLKDGEIIKAQSDAPNYRAAPTPQRCKNCLHFTDEPGGDLCELYDFIADQDYVCDDWEAQIPDEIPGYVANKADLAALTEGILILRGGETPR